eukprot:PITA_02219
MDARLKNNTDFHLQTNGQTEVVNKTVIQLLRGYCSKHPRLWDEHLRYVQHAYNQAKHSSTQRFPFETCFGFTPRSPLDFVFSKDTVFDGHSDVDKSTKFIEQTRHGKHQMEHSFQFGDQVQLYINKDEYKVKEDTVLDRKVRTTRRGHVEYLRIGLKGSKPSGAKWIEVGQARNQYPHLIDA